MVPRIFIEQLCDRAKIKEQREVSNMFTHSEERSESEIKYGSKSNRVQWLRVTGPSRNPILSIRTRPFCT